MMTSLHPEVATAWLALAFLAMTGPLTPASPPLALAWICAPGFILWFYRRASAGPAPGQTLSHGNWKQEAVTGERFSVRFGDAAEAEMGKSVPASDDELLQRAMSMLEELSLADFLSKEFRDEYRALAKAWAHRGTTSTA